MAHLLCTPDMLEPEAILRTPDVLEPEAILRRATTKACSSITWADKSHLLEPETILRTPDLSTMECIDDNENY
jgi:hypothetical protein